MTLASSDEPEAELVLLSHVGRVAVVTLNRPDSLNALSHALIVKLRTVLRDAAATSRAVVLTGAGRAFSAGADLRGGPSDAEDVLRRYYAPLVGEMRQQSVPLVAAVNGAAAGAGLALALACDLRVAGPPASFRAPFVKVGLVPDAGTTWFLPRAVGTARAAEMALLGRVVSADLALAWGLVNEVADDPLGRAIEIAGDLAALSASVGPTRRLLHASLDRGLGDQLDAEAHEQGLAQLTPDYAEARAAFAERREPKFAVPARAQEAQPWVSPTVANSSRR